MTDVIPRRSPPRALGSVTQLVDAAAPVPALAEVPAPAAAGERAAAFDRRPNVDGATGTARLLGSNNALAIFGAAGERAVALPPVDGGRPVPTWLTTGVRRLAQLEGLPAVVTEGSRSGYASRGIHALRDYAGVIKNLAERDDPPAFAVVPQVYTAIEDRHQALNPVDDHVIEIRPQRALEVGMVLGLDTVRLVPPGSIVTLDGSRFKVVAHGSTDESDARSHCLIVQSIDGGGRDLKVARGAALTGAVLFWAADAPAYRNGAPLGPPPRR